MLLFGGGSGEQGEAWLSTLMYDTINIDMSRAALSVLALYKSRKAHMSDLSRDLGRAIKTARTERGLSPAEVINRLPDARRRSAQTLSRYERGKTKAPAEFLMDFERALEIPYGSVTRTAAEMLGEAIPPSPLPFAAQLLVEDEDGNLRPEQEAWQSALMDSIGRAPRYHLARALYEAEAAKPLAATLGQTLADRVGRYFDALDHEIPGAGIPAARLARALIAELDRLIEDDEVLQRYFYTVKDASEEGEIILALLQLLRRLAKDPSPKVGDWGRGGPESVRAEGGA